MAYFECLTFILQICDKRLPYTVGYVSEIVGYFFAPLPKGPFPAEETHICPQYRHTHTHTTF